MHKAAAIRAPVSDLQALTSFITFLNLDTCTSEKVTASVEAHARIFMSETPRLFLQEGDHHDQ
jgi:hypothetical protein